MIDIKPEKVVVGFLSGAGVDGILRGTAGNYIPQLTEPSPLKLPGYDPNGVHWDDLIALGIGAAVAGYGAMKKDNDLTVFGATMALGSYITSVVFQPAVPEPPVTAIMPVETFKNIYVD